MDNTLDTEYEDAMVEAFVNKPSKTLWYQVAFKKFNFHGVDTLKWHWSWWAFFTGFLFLLYRKQYIPALVLFVLSFILGLIPFGFIISMVLSGGYATYFIYKGYKQKRLEIEATIEDKTQRIEAMRAVGGYHQWVIWIYIVFVLLFVFTATAAFITMPPM